MSIRFGPAGNSEAFYESGHKHTYEAPEWLAGLGLSAFEYSFGRGIKLKKPETGRAIAEQAEAYGVQMSVHAPYYINLANDEFEKNLAYFMESTVAAGYLGAGRIVFHPGSESGQNRADAVAKVKKNLAAIIKELKAGGYTDVTYCAETMGRIGQIGDLEETIELCALDEQIYPAIDFGHLNSRTLGGIKTEDDYAAILDALAEGIGVEKYRNMHIHFSRIEYTAKGEKMHLTFEDDKWGPDWEPLARQIKKRGLTPVVICESRGTQALDAVTMKSVYEAVEI